MANNPVFKTRDNRIIRIARGQIKSDLSGAPLETIRVSIKGRAAEVTTDLTPREVLVLVELFLYYYRRTLPQEPAWPRGETQHEAI